MTDSKQTLIYKLKKQAFHDAGRFGTIIQLDDE
jgi:hypothetical protein